MIKMPWLWLIPAGIITVALVSYVLVIGLGNLMIRHDWNKLVRQEMASVEKEYRDLCGHLLNLFHPGWASRSCSTWMALASFPARQGSSGAWRGPSMS